jgi:hypothetical protein
MSVRRFGAVALTVTTILLAGCFPDPAPGPGPSAAANCPANDDCPPEVTATGSGITATASFGSGTDNATLHVNINPGNDPEFECYGYPRQVGTVVTEFHFSGGDGSDRIGTLSISFESPEAEPDLADYQSCWAAPYPFTDDNLNEAAVQGVKPGTGDPLYVGLLPQCDWGDDFVRPPPCVQDKWYDSETDLIHIVIQTTGADPWRY